MYIKLAPARYNLFLTVYKPFKNNSQSSIPTKLKPFYCRKFVIAPVNSFRLVIDTPECTIEFLKKDKEKIPKI